MASRGVTSLADISRYLKTTPQAVSNWKARDQVPYHIESRINSGNVGADTVSLNTDITKENIFSISDILLILAQQLKIITIVTIAFLFIGFTFNWSTNQVYYKSSAKILLANSKSSTSGLAGLASQFGVNVSQGVATADLSSVSLFPEILQSYTFLERMEDQKFYVEKFQKELSLLEILIDDTEASKENRDSLFKSAMKAFLEMVSLTNEGSFSVLNVKAKEPVLARDINLKVLEELQELNRYYKSKNVSERIKFINNRIEKVGKELENSEQKLKIFREQNRQIVSPALQLSQERLSRDVDIQKGIFLTLKQQLELANIEKIQNEALIQIFEYPRIPINGTGKNIRLVVLISSLLGLFAGIGLGFIRAYFNNDDIDERKKLRRVRNFIKKKGKDIILDRRISAIFSILFLCGLPFYIGHRSQNPVFFGMYSPTLLIVNIIYIITTLFFTILFIRNSKK